MNSHSVILFILFISLSSCTFAGPVSGNGSSLLARFTEQKIVPDVVEIAPNDAIQVIYSDGSMVQFGNELTPSQVKQAPLNVSWPVDEASLYTLLMVDPDAPSRAQPTLGEVNHWLVVNIKGNDISSGETITPYLGSMPPKDTGLHRYTFLAFKQPSPVQLHKIIARKLRSNAIESRLNFSTRNFMRQNNLGNPIAGNFYLAQFTELGARP